MVHAKALVSNETKATGSVTIEGQVFGLVYGYPTRGVANSAGTAASPHGINKLIELESGTSITYVESTGVFSHSQATTAANCSVTYSIATAAGAVVTPAKAVLDVNGC